jgi:hypothetical protein
MMPVVRFGPSTGRSLFARWRYKLALDSERLGVGRYEISVALRSFEVLDLSEPVPGRSLELKSVVSRAKGKLTYSDLSLAATYIIGPGVGKEILACSAWASAFDKQLT